MIPYKATVNQQIVNFKGVSVPEVTRLFSQFKPQHYSIEIDFDIDKLTFLGRCTIIGTPTNNTVLLHATELDINSVRINRESVKHTLEEDLLSIENLGYSANKSIEIEIIYSGKITQAMHGIYLSKTVDDKLIIATQFESHHAREAFPCIDEPEAKATFDVTLITNNGLTVLGNMPINTQEVAENKSKTAFNTTPIMSTYLVAFVFGEMQKVSATTSGGTEVSVYSAPNHDIEALVFPLEVAVKTIEFLNEYFEVDYPLPKLDQVALPDFSSGAMENWGLVTYREVALIADPETISTSSKEFIATVIAHELAHQWFGNLVTMKWWDDLWLNESFATLMEYLIIDALYPEWNVMLSFASHDALSAYRRDILPGVQAVATPVQHPDEISTLFDPSIVYAKGARLLLMAYHLVGDKAFRKGLKNYFNTYEYSNTIGNDLWNSLTKASGIDVESIMGPWIHQSGLPYLIVDQNSDGAIKLEQNQLISDHSSTEQTWPIPLWPSSQIKINILDSKETIIDKAPMHVRFNTIGGHYVAKYKNSSTIKEIAKQIDKNKIKPDGRLLFLHDSLLLARCGVSSINETLSALSGYKNEDQEAVWSVISLALSDARMLIEGDEETEILLKNYTYNLIENKLKQLGWNAKDKDTSNDKKLRDTLVSLAIYTENKESINKALDIYKTSQDVQDIPSDIRGAVLTCVAKNGPQSDYNKLLELYPNTTSADIQLDLTGALCATKDEDNIIKLVGKLKDEEFVRLQDLDRFLVYLLRNRFSRQYAWQWMVENWDWITEKFSGDMSYDSYPRYAASAFSSQRWLDEFNKHFKPLQDIPALTRNIELGVKDIQNKIQWRKNDQQNIIGWLKDQ